MSQYEAILAALQERLKATHEDVTEIKKYLEKLETTFISKKEFWPVKIIVYSTVGIILTSFLGILVQGVLAWTNS